MRQTRAGVRKPKGWRLPTPARLFDLMKRVLIRLCFYLAISTGFDTRQLKAPRLQKVCTVMKSRQHHVKIAKHFYS